MSEQFRYTTPPIGSITVKNSPLWKSDPQQQLGYFAARSWARRHCPEVILGVYDRDEAEQFTGPDNAKDITPSKPSLAERLAQASNRTDTPTDTREGFSATFDRPEPEFTPAGEYEDFQNPGDIPSSDNAASHAATEAGASVPLDAPASPDLIEEQLLSGKDKASLIECANKLFAITQDETLEVLKRREALAIAKEAWKSALNEALHEKLKAIFISADAVIRGKGDYGAATEIFADMLECDVEEIRGAS